MKYKLLEKEDLKLMKEIIEDDNMDFDLNNLQKFLNDKNNYGFIAKEENKIIGFIYGYSLLKPLYFQSSIHCLNCFFIFSANSVSTLIACKS